MPDETPAILPEGQGLPLGKAGLPDLLPPSIGKDETVRRLATAVEEEIRRFAERQPLVLLWSAIERLEEPLLTHLAVMLHADWWDAAWSLSGKRRFLLRQVALHRAKGTAWAVEEAVSLVYGAAQVREWFEYGGDRGCFIVNIEVLDLGLTDDQLARIERMISKYKRKSQHLCALAFNVGSRVTARTACAVFIDEEISLNVFVPADITVERTPVRAASGLYLNEEIILNLQGD